MNFEISGLGQATGQVDDLVRPNTIAAQLGLGTAFQKAGLFENFGYAPGTAAQSRTIERLRMVAQESENAILEVRPK